MYIRKFDETPKSIIQHGYPVFGTFKEPFANLDIRGVKFPFGDIPFPHFLTNFRIRAGLSFCFATPEFVGFIDIFDARIFAISEIILWETQTQKKIVFRKLLFPFLRRLIPLSLQNATCANLNQKYYFRIAWNRAAGTFSVLVNLHADTVRPPIKLALSIDLQNEKVAQLTSVLPALVLRRCLASHQITGPVSGSIGIAQDEIITTKGIALFDIHRLYCKLRTKIKYVVGFGLVDGKQVSFRLASSSFAASDEYTYNENALFVDGKTWTLPPVKIASSFGISAIWTIQDTESMVDLAFTPISTASQKVSAFFMHRDFHVMYGTFEGVLLTGEGESIFIKSFSGIAKRLRIRL